MTPGTFVLIVLTTLSWFTTVSLPSPDEEAPWASQWGEPARSIAERLRASRRDANALLVALRHARDEANLLRDAGDPTHERIRNEAIVAVRGSGFAAPLVPWHSPAIRELALELTLEQAQCASDARHRGYAWMTRGYLLMQGNELAEAEAAYAQAMASFDNSGGAEISPSVYAGILRGLADVRRRQGDHAGALAVRARFLELPILFCRSDDEAAMMREAGIDAFRTGDVDLGRAWFARLWQRFPDYGLNEGMWVSHKLLGLNRGEFASDLDGTRLDRIDGLESLLAYCLAHDMPEQIEIAGRLAIDLLYKSARRDEDRAVRLLRDARRAYTAHAQRWSQTLPEARITRARGAYVDVSTWLITTLAPEVIDRTGRLSPPPGLAEAFEIARSLQSDPQLTLNEWGHQDSIRRLHEIYGGAEPK